VTAVNYCGQIDETQLISIVADRPRALGRADICAHGRALRDFGLRISTSTAFLQKTVATYCDYLTSTIEAPPTECPRAANALRSLCAEPRLSNEHR